MSKTLYIVNGPNLNLLGTREPEIYGHQTLADIEALSKVRANSHGFDVVFVQSNIEGELVDHIQKAGQSASALIINPAAYSHTSVALYDSIKALDIPVIEIHISQPAARESFRALSYVAMAATASISGLGVNSYLLGIDAAIGEVEKNKDEA